MEERGKLNGISLFTGYAGIDIALRDYVRPLIYCEIERYPQGIILSRMDEGSIEFAPIWNDVESLNGAQFKGLVDIVYGGFPCQDISTAGKGAGLAGKRSGLFFQVIRVCKESSPLFIFLENVPGIRTRGAIEVQEALANIGYASRWLHLSAAEVGANHKRERWFCLAFRKEALSNSAFQDDGFDFSGESKGQVQQFGIGSFERNMANSNSKRLSRQTSSTTKEDNQGIRESDGGPMSSATDSGFRETEISESEGLRVQGLRSSGFEKSHTHDREGLLVRGCEIFNPSFWKVEPNVGRVVDGTANRMDRVKALGNGVVPFQVKTAFEKLMGIIQ
jgi:DNA (cytosine-5)-methyltransferase 1